MGDMSAGERIPGATVIIPTYNERDNIAALVSRVSAAVSDRDVEILFVDDSSDDTPDVIRRIAVDAPVPVRLLHRESPWAVSAAPWWRASPRPPTTCASSWTAICSTRRSSCPT